MTTDQRDAAAQFEAHRRTLFAVAYRMLGTVTDAEDVVQETWLSWSSADRTAVEKPVAYLTRIAVNHALKRLKEPARRHETYPGPWLPEPLLGDHDGDDAAEAAVRVDDVSLAMLVVLETLSPLERAVFILRETFGYDYAEIGAMLDRSAAAARQAAHRARAHVQARRPRFPVDRDIQRTVTRTFLAAAAGGDLSALVDLLDPDVELWTDGGGRARAARNVIHGRDKVARFVTATFDHEPLLRKATMTEVLVNGDPGILVESGGAVLAVAIVELTEDGTRARAIYAVRNPDKLGGAIAR